MNRPLRRRLEDGHVLVCDLAVDLDLEVGDRGVGQRVDHAAQTFGQGNARAHVLVDGSTGDVDSVGDEFTGQCLAHGLGDGHAGLLLRFSGRCAEVGRDVDGVEVHERRVLRGFRAPHVDACTADLTCCDRLGEGVLVDDAAAGDVDEPGAGLGGLEFFGADHADRLRRLGHVDGHEVGHGQQSGQVDDLDAHLRGACLRDVGVVADQSHAEGLGTLGDEAADASESDDAQSLLVEFHAGVLRALPFPALSEVLPAPK